MLRNLQYLQDGDPPFLVPDDSGDDEFSADQAAAEIPPLRAAPIPSGYMVSDQGGMIAPDAAVAPIGDQVPMSVIRYPKATYINRDAKGNVVGRGEMIQPQRDVIPVPVNKPASVALPTDPGWTPGDLPDNNPLPWRGQPLPAPAPRFIGKDRNLQGALETARQTDAEMPIRPTPTLLNRIGAGALGAAAGWSNAARRAAPIDIKAVTEPILYPGYDQAMATWQSRQAAAQKQVENYGQQVGAEMASQKAQSENALKFAQAEAAIKHGDYWERRSEQERNQWKMAPDGSLYNTISGQRVTAPPTADARYKAAMAITGGDKERSAFYALNGKLPTPTQHNVSEWQSYLDANGGDSTKALAAKNRDDIHKAIASRDPSMASYRNFEEQTSRDAAANRVNKERVDEEQRINSDMHAKLTALTTSGQAADRAKREAEIKASAAGALTAMQKKYVDAIRRAGGSADDMDVDPVTLQWKPRVAASNPYSPAAKNPYRQQ